jgi:hypothetical protein
MVSVNSSFNLLALLGLLLITKIHAATELSVTVYEGPTDCAEENKVRKGKSLTMHYTGSIDESSETGEIGKVFDSSHNRGKAFEFTFGVGQVIKGWDHGLKGLCKGAKATLVIPPIMGYGARGAGGTIPGGATLKFDVEVVGISDIEDVSPEDEPNIFGWLDENNDGKLSKEEIEAYFSGQGREMPHRFMEEEDKDGDGFVSWDEFSGPKGSAPADVKDEL